MSKFIKPSMKEIYICRLLELVNKDEYVYTELFCELKKNISNKAINGDKMIIMFNQGIYDRKFVLGKIKEMIEEKSEPEILEMYEHYILKIRKRKSKQVNKALYKKGDSPKIPIVTNHYPSIYAYFLKSSI